MKSMGATLGVLGGVLFLTMGIGQDTPEGDGKDVLIPLSNGDPEEQARLT